ncbi:uncharacterized protein [Amphiura filiformis]|uniref:uncharacterized protein n=1 Tax=Amphiura filiformis TaxID=82378 RepID=UPI003B21312B
MAMDYLASKAKSQAVKHGKRAGAKVLQKMGAEGTRDPVFDDFNFSFQKQMAQSEKLKQEIGRYEHCLKEMKKAMKGLNDIMADFYEDFWPQAREFQLALQDQETICGNLIRDVHNLADPLRRYQINFVDIKERVKKRENKLMDYDTARRALDKAYNSPKVTDDKINKLENEFTAKEEDYKYLNDDLIRDIPPVLETRGPFVLQAFTTYFKAQELFCAENYKVAGALTQHVSALQGQQLEVSVGRERRGRQGGGQARSSGGGGGPKPGERTGQLNTRGGGRGQDPRGAPQGGSLRGSYDSRPGPGLQEPMMVDGGHIVI